MRPGVDEAHRVPTHRPMNNGSRPRCYLCVLPSGLAQVGGMSSPTPTLKGGAFTPPGPRARQTYRRGRAGAAEGLAPSGSGRRPGPGRSPRPQRCRSPAAGAAPRGVRGTSATRWCRTAPSAGTASVCGREGQEEAAVTTESVWPPGRGLGGRS